MDIKKLISHIDLTSLNANDTDESIRTLCQKAQTPLGNVAAVCVYPRFVPIAKEALRNTRIFISAVANFPEGNQDLAHVFNDIEQAIKDGADEIDVVIPYQAYMNGDRQSTKYFIQSCKKACNKNILKVILETGKLNDSTLIEQATRDAIEAGADFIKTSTGKVPVGATIESATTILNTINTAQHTVNHPIGFKASGGIRTKSEAQQYLKLTQDIMGPTWATPRTFRIGASSLLDDLLSS